jgi:hypothetical protein
VPQALVHAFAQKEGWRYGFQLVGWYRGGGSGNVNRFGGADGSAGVEDHDVNRWALLEVAGMLGLWRGDPVEGSIGRRCSRPARAGSTIAVARAERHVVVGAVSRRRS